MFTRYNWVGGTSLRLMVCFSLSDITCCRLVLSMNLHRSHCSVIFGLLEKKKKKPLDKSEMIIIIKLQLVLLTNQQWKRYCVCIFVYTVYWVAMIEKCCHPLLSLWNRMKIFLSSFGCKHAKRKENGQNISSRWRRRRTGMIEEVSGAERMAAKFF